MNEYMREKERPYSPPMREREGTEEEEVTVERREMNVEK